MDTPEQNERNKLLESIKKIYHRALEGLTNQEMSVEDFVGAPPRGIPHAVRAKRRTKNRRARASRLYNRLRMKGAHV